MKFDGLVAVIVLSLLGVGGVFVWIVSMVLYETYGAEPQKRQAKEQAWRERCIAGGNTLLPTERHYTKSGDAYGGWICAKVTRVEP